MLACPRRLIVSFSDGEGDDETGMVVTDANKMIAPAWEAVKYVNKRFVKEDIFYTMDETSKDLDAVWLNLTGREYLLCFLTST
jgi:hypothetical protein